LIIKVKDNGIGIPAEKIGNIFTRFFQVDNPGLEERGNGIGLSLVKEFVNLHKGNIGVESEIGKGTTFIISLPVALHHTHKGKYFPRFNEPESYPDHFQVAKPLDESAIAVQAEDIPDHISDNETVSDNLDGLEENWKESAQRKPIILIAEDDDDLRYYLKDNLQKKYHICEAANGEDAFIKILKIVPDLIISDIMMQGIDGIKLCRSVKSDRNISHIPFILLTARYSEQDQLEGIESGADDYITKPFNFQILESKINNSIKNRKNIHSLFKNKKKLEQADINITSLDEQFLQKAIAIVEKNMSVTDFTVREFSRELGMSRTLLYKKLLLLTEKPPLEFIRFLRMKRAALLLIKSQLNVSEITFRVGFKDPKYFRKHFLKEFGVLPSKYADQFIKEFDK
jgi:DNA-binding response OmpR family regulator